MANQSRLQSWNGSQTCLVLFQITINDLPVGRDVDETLRLVQAFKFTDEHGEVCPAGWKPGKKTMKPNAEGVAKYLGENAHCTLSGARNCNLWFFIRTLPVDFFQAFIFCTSNVNKILFWASQVVWFLSQVLSIENKHLFFYLDIQVDIILSRFFRSEIKVFKIAILLFLLYYRHL